MELLFDHQRIANALEARLDAELSCYKVNRLQMWLLLLVGGLHRGAMRGRQALSANEVAVELCVKRTRVANEFARLRKRKLIAPATPVFMPDKRAQSFVLTAAGRSLAGTLKIVLETIERRVLIDAGWRATDRVVDPQYMILGLWLTGHRESQLPTLTRLMNVPSDLVAGTRRNAGHIRLKRIWRLLAMALPPKLPE